MSKCSLVRQCPGLQLDDYKIIPLNNKINNAENLDMFFGSAVHITDIPGYR